MEFPVKKTELSYSLDPDRIQVGVSVVPCTSKAVQQVLDAIEEAWTRAIRMPLRTNAGTRRLRPCLRLRHRPSHSLSGRNGRNRRVVSSESMVDETVVGVCVSPQLQWDAARESSRRRAVGKSQFEFA
jgi:hypothetical protein